MAGHVWCLQATRSEGSKMFTLNPSLAGAASWPTHKTFHSNKPGLYRSNVIRCDHNRQGSFRLSAVRQSPTQFYSCLGSTLISLIIYPAAPQPFTKCVLITAVPLPQSRLHGSYITCRLADEENA